MVYMTKNQYDSKLAKIQRRNESIERKRKLREERMRYWPKFVLPSTSKIVLIVSAILCLEILAFCQYMIIKTGDTNALYAMVGALFTFMAVVLGYFVKSTKENTIGGLVYDSTMAKMQTPVNNNTNEEAVG
jgi:hypothetical protein